ncbi:hypothetical protein niasHT_003632 [Heterodera trifolii]|uniref:B30.2/SPRY domain-containing protein n=1 Tax=Heterodera trifolii TaxID=157864 RepID=A0ABD2MEU3_9BILA
MATFNVAHLITLIGVGSIASSVGANEQQNQNKTQNGGGGLKHLFGPDVFTELRDKQNAMAEKMSETETKLEKQIENGMRESQILLSTKLENVFIKLRDNQNASVTKLENRFENVMRDNQNALAEKVSETEAKLENQIENENQNALAEKVSETEAKLENQIEKVFTELRDNQNGLSTKLENRFENVMRDNQNALAEKVSETEAKLENQIENVFTELRDNQNGLSTKLENGIQNNQKALSLMKNMATLALFHFPLPIYHRWNASDCHPEIVINESTNAIQRNSTGREDIGLSTKEMPLYTRLGNGRVSYGYVNIGKIESENANGNGVEIQKNVPPFYTGDVVGCGLNWATRQVFFTKNGQRLNITNLYVDEDTADVYPTVTLDYHGDAVEANFGPNFQYDLSKK